jgi:N-acetyl-anhydromuramyl-L-alanine amidase AmpD
MAPAPSPVTTPTSSTPAAAKSAPPIQNITQLLKRHPTARFGTRALNQIQRVIIHHTAIPANIGADRIANFGVEKKGWPAIKYHYFITGDGQIQQTNELTADTTHAGPYSAISIGVGFAGDFTNNGPTPAQIDAGTRLIAWLLPQYGLSVENVVGYKELINTQSPGQQWDAGLRWGDQLKARIRAYL